MDKICPKCGEQMDFEIGIHRWNERTWYCSECEIEITEDITGDLIDQEMLRRGDNE